MPATTFAQNDARTISCGQVYTIASGDTLSQINRRAYGDLVFDNLYQANRAVIGPNPNVIFVGQQLEIPCPLDETVAAAAAEAPVVEEPTPEELEPVSTTGKLTFTFNKASAPKFIINSGIIDLYLAEIAEVTEGRVSFVDPVVMNRDPAVQFDLIQSGDVDATYVFNGYLSESHPLLQLPMLPLMGGSAEQTAVSLWRLHAEYLAETNYFDDAKLLGFVAAPAAHIWRLSDEPVVAGQGIVDQNNYAVPYFDGLDTRGPAKVREENEMRLAAFNEEANGTLTFFMAHGAARAAGVWTDDRTVTEVANGLYTPTFSVVLSNDAWGQISPQDQAAIDAISGEVLAVRSASWDAFDNGHRSHMLTTGLNVVKADDAILAELEATLADRLVAWSADAAALGIPAVEAISAYRANIAALQDLLVFE
ncbi:LysM peptidoglycan-binding domain-containing protein [Yoonia sp. 2307UL14-13]|uniref:LysM peptidoglycan-binding domain-containing protein n=1 Tax=Yoonia sp. 2307UL14-13 TaxID=3126506 RepID=UPI0030EF09FA